MVVVVNSGGQDIRTMSESTRSVPRTANLRPRRGAYSGTTLNWILNGKTSMDNNYHDWIDQCT